MDASNARTRHICGLAGIAAALLASTAMGTAPLPANQFAWGDEPTFQQITEDQDASFTPAEPSTGPSDLPNTTLPPVYPADVQVAGCVTVAVPGTFYDTETRALLDRVNQIRAEAAAEGLAVDGQAVSGAPLTWSDGLAYVAQIRAVETALFGSENGNRPNGTGTVTAADPANPFSALGISSEATDNGMSATDCLNTWYAEKQAYLDYLETGVAAGEFSHYRALIADGSDYLGLGCFTVDGSNAVTLVLERATLPAASGTERSDGQAVQQICVAPEMLDARIEVVSGSTAAKVGDALQLTARVTPAVADPNSIETPMEPIGSEDVLLSDSMDTAETVVDLTPYIALEWASDNPGVAAVDAFGQVNILTAGAATITVGQGDVCLASLEITVEAAPASITSVEQPAGVATANGVAPELPATVRAAWSDGSATDEPVFWDAVDPALYSDPQGGAFSATGWIAGWDQPVSCQVTVEAAPAQITGVEQPAGVATANGVAPGLPATVRAAWSDGSATDEPVFWDAVDPALYSDPQGGSFAATGWVAGWDQPITCQVSVEAAPATIASVEQPAGVSTANGVAPELPATVRAAWSDGSATDEPVFWDAVDPALYSDPQGGAFSATGWVAGWDEPVACQVTVEAAPASITSVEQPAGVSTANGVAPELPATVRAAWSDGSATDEPVFWDAVDPALYFSRAGGTFNVTGQVAGWPEPVSCQVEVAPAIASAEPLGVETVAGVAPALPQSVSIVWSNGDRVAAPAAWNTVDPTSYAAPGSFTATGIANLDGTALDITCTVSVESPDAISATTPQPVTTLVGIAPELPQTTQVTWSNGLQTDAAVRWGGIDPACYATAGSFTISGMVEGTSLTVDLTVNVQNARIVSVAAVTLTTPAGIAPSLPANVEATWEDGAVTSETVRWQAVNAASYATQGSVFTVAGLLAVDGATSVEATVTVEAPRAVSAHAISAVVTTAGTAPQLPTTVPVTLSDGSVVDAPIAWNALDATSYQSAGQFVVEGTAQGLTVSATVSVLTPKATGVQNATVSTTVGVAPVLPETLQVTWSNGAVSNEPVTWQVYSSALYQKAGTFRVAGTVAGLQASAVVTVNPAPAATGQPQDTPTDQPAGTPGAGTFDNAGTSSNTDAPNNTGISATADGSVDLAIIVGSALAGLAAICAGVVLTLKERRSRR